MYDLYISCRFPRFANTRSRVHSGIASFQRPNLCRTKANYTYLFSVTGIAVIFSAILCCPGKFDSTPQANKRFCSPLPILQNEKQKNNGHLFTVIWPVCTVYSKSYPFKLYSNKLAANYRQIIHKA